jgi:hypothetical protein
MGSGTQIDVAALRDIADQFEQSADALDVVVHTGVAQRGFGGATAGRDYVARGEALCAAMDDIADALSAWSRASSEICASLRASADRYLASDARNAAQFS